MRLKPEDIAELKNFSAKYKGAKLKQGTKEVAEWLRNSPSASLVDLIDDAKKAHPNWNRAALVAAIGEVYGNEKAYSTDPVPVTNLGKIARQRVVSAIEKKSDKTQNIYSVPLLGKFSSLNKAETKQAFHEGTGSVLKAGAGQFGIDLDLASNPVSEGFVNWGAAPVGWLVGGGAVSAAAKAGKLGATALKVASALERLEAAGKTAQELSKMTAAQVLKETAKTVGRKAVAGAIQVAAPMTVAAPVAVGMEIAGNKGAVKRYAQNVGMGAVAGAGFGTLGAGLSIIAKSKAARYAKTVEEQAIAVEKILADANIDKKQFARELDNYNKTFGTELDISNPKQVQGVLADIKTQLKTKSELLGTLEARKTAKQKANVRAAQTGNAEELARINKPKIAQTPIPEEVLADVTNINAAIPELERQQQLRTAAGNLAERNKEMQVRYEAAQPNVAAQNLRAKMHNEFKGMRGKGGFLVLDPETALYNAKTFVKKGVDSFEDFSNKMKAIYGEDVAPMLENLWKQSHKELKLAMPSIIRSISSAEQPPETTTPTAAPIAGSSNLPPASQPKYIPRNLNPKYIQLTDELGNDLTPDVIKETVTRDLQQATEGEILDPNRIKRLQPQSHDKTLALAHALNPNPKVGQALNAEQITALGQVWSFTEEAFRDAKARYEVAPTPENKLDLEDAKNFFVTKSFQLFGATNEAGRTLNALQITKKARALMSGTTDIDEKQNILKATYKALAESFPGADIPEEITKQIADNLDNPLELAKIIKKNMKFSMGEKINAYIMGDILSGIKTHIVNITTNTALAAGRLGMKPVYAAIDAPLAKLTGRERAYYADDVAPAIAGSIKGTAEGLKRFTNIMKTGFDTKYSEGEFTKPYYEFSFLPLKGLNYVGRSLRAADAFAKSVMENSEMYTIARRNGIKQGFKGDQLHTYITNSMDNPTPEMLKKAMESGKEATLQQDFGSWMSKISGILNTPIPKSDNFIGDLVGGLKPLKLIVPFIQVPTNMLKLGIKYSPMGYAELLGKSRVYANDIERNAGAWSKLTNYKSVLRNPESVETIGKATVGSMITAMAYMANKSGIVEITGAPPTERSERNLYFETKQPYSIKVGGNWYNYGKLGAAAFPLVVAASLVEGERQGKDNFERTTTALGQMLRFNFDQSFMRGLNGVMDILSGDVSVLQDLPGGATKTLFNTANMFVPYKSAVNTVTQLADPVYREYDNIWEMMKSQTPVVSKQLQPKVGVWGNNVKRPGGMLGALYPFAPTPELRDPEKGVSKELERLRVIPSYTTNKYMLDGKEATLTNAQYTELKRRIGKERLSTVWEYIKDPNYLNMNDEERADSLEYLLTESKRNAKGKYLYEIQNK